MPVRIEKVEFETHHLPKGLLNLDYAQCPYSEHSE